MQIRVQRSVNVVPENQKQFLEFALKGIEHFQSATGIEPELFVNLRPVDRPVEVRIFTDFESMAQYEDIFLHKTLRDDSYLDMPEAVVDMIYNQPQNEMYVRLDADDHFMNRKGGRVVATSALDLSRGASLNKKVATYRTEREYRASKGRLRDTMFLSFEFMHNLHGASGHAADLFCTRFFCTRFSARGIGSVKLYFVSNDCPQCGPAFLQQDQEIATNHQDLLQHPPITTVYNRMLPTTLAYDVRASTQPTSSP